MSDQNQIASEISRPGVANQTGTAEELLNPQIQLEDAMVEEISNWLQNELLEAANRRSDMEEKMNMLMRTYEANPEEERKSFPWDGACNLVVPVAATAVEAVFTRITQAIFGMGDLYSGRQRSANWAEAVEPTIDWLNWVNANVFDAERVYGRWVLSCIKYGTSVIKLPWVRRTREVRYMDSAGGLVQERIVLHDGPKPEFIPLEDFFWSNDANTTQDIQGCEWVAQRFYTTWKQLKEAELSGDYLEVDRIKENKRTTFKDSESDMQEITGEVPQEPGDYELYEVWASYPIDEEGTLAEIVVTYHLETRTVLRAVFNFYRHQERPFHLVTFFPRENHLTGIGLVEMLADVQEEVTAIHRNRLDNATLANAKVYKRTKGANVRFEDVYPGALLDVDNEGDLTNMDMGMPHDTLLKEEMHTITIGEKRSGVSDYTVGRESSAIGSRATATSTMALIREGNVRFRFLIRQLRNSLTDIGQQIIALYQQFAPNREVMYEIFSETEKQWFQKLMTLPPEYSRANIAIDVKALDENTNEEMKQQALMMMMKVMQETYMNIGNALMLLTNPQAPDPVKMLAQQGAIAASKLIERLLESFGFEDAETFAPNMQQILGMQAALDMGGAIGQFTQGGPQGVGGPPNQPPVEAAPAGSGAPAGGGGAGPSTAGMPGSGVSPGSAGGI